MSAMECGILSIINECVLDVASQYGGASPGLVTTYDKSRYHNDGTLANVTWEQQGDGIWVPVFDGANGSINIAASDSLANIFTNGGGTLMAWVNPSSDGQGDDGAMFVKLNGGYLFDINNGSEAGGFVGIGLYTYWTGANGTWTTGVVVPINTTTHITLTYNADNVANNPIIYLNGEPLTVGDGLTEDTTPTGVKSDDTAQALCIGNRQPGGGSSWEGYLSRNRAWTYILTPAQIRAKYHAEKRISRVPL